MARGGEHFPNLADAQPADYEGRSGVWKAAAAYWPAASFLRLIGDLVGGVVKSARAVARAFFNLPIAETFLALGLILFLLYAA